MDSAREEERGGQLTISPAIPGLWIHSWEEDASDVEVYRRFFDFPSFPRDAFELLRDHTFIQEEVDAAGAVVAEQARGHFSQPAVDTLDISFDDGTHPGFALQAVELSDDLDLLRVRRFTGLNGSVPILYQLSDQEMKLRIRMIASPSGIVQNLRYGIGAGDDLVFSGTEISTQVTPDRIRATVVLEPGTAIISRRSFEVTVPVVVVGAEVPDQGPFGVFAAALRIEHFPGDGTSIGPKEAYDAIVLTGRAIGRPPTD